MLFFFRTQGIRLQFRPRYWEPILMRIVMAILFLLSSELVALAGPLDDANSAYEKGEFSSARHLYDQLALQGDRTAQFRLGVLYEDGKGVAKDGREALRWYSVASAQGSPEAAYNLGRLYHDGRGIPQNHVRARRWYLVAARRDETRAAVNLGVMNASGEGGPRDYRKAIEWFLFAAQRGDDRAKINLGTMWFNGQGVPRDLVRAHMWYNLAAAHGDPDAIQERASVAHLMSASQIARAQQMASDRQDTFP
jgi:TPR repeat protein